MVTESPAVLLLRTLLFMPGNRPRLLEKAAGLAVDGVILDLEDSVPVDEKLAARRLVATAIAGARSWRADAYVRANAVDGPFWRDDLEAIVGSGLSGLVLPKVESAVAIATAEAHVGHWERVRGLTPGAIRLLPTIETAVGLLDAVAIARASPRVVALVFGAEDFTLDLGASRSKGGLEILYARSTLAVAAAAARIQAIDTVWTDLEDQAGLRREAEFVRQLGFAGKCLIHPKQIEPVGAAFAPTPEEVARAREIVAAFAAAEAAGSGAVALHGQMIDPPIVARARRMLALGEAPRQTTG